jgi:acetolactate synthase-1/2/3 large subunit
MKVSDFIFQYLKSQGVEHVFVLVGGGSMHLDDSLGKSGIPYTVVLHEQAGAIAAHAYSMYKHSMGVMLTTSGPGATNALTGCSNAWAESIPVLFISGQAKRSTLTGSSGVRQMGSQEVDIIPMVRGITKHAMQVLDPLNIRYQLEKSFSCARAGRPGPVWLDIPVDVQGAEINEAELRGYTQTESYASERLGFIEAQADKTWGLLRNSQRPVLFAGYGIQASGAEEDFRKLVEALGIPVLVTWKEIGILPDDHPLYVGRPGKIGQRGANFAQQNCDLLISIGARLDFEQVAFQPQHFAYKAKKVIVDIDMTEIHKLDMDIDVLVCGDAGQFIRELLKRVKTLNKPKWVERCAEWKKKYPIVLPEYKYSDDLLRVNSYVFMDDLSDLATSEDVLAPGSSGASVESFMQGWKVKEGQRFVFAPGLGSMGYDIPNALGAAIASGKRTICITGDGGFQLNIQDLETIRRLKLPVKFFVMNNGGYGSIMAMQRNYFEGRYVGSNSESGLTLPPLDKIAEAYGFQHYKIVANLVCKKTIAEVLNISGPVICEVSVDPFQLQQPRVGSVIQTDGSIVSSPMEDMSPLLPRDEFNGNMQD